MRFMKCIYMRYECSVRNNNPQAGWKDQTLALPSGVEIPFRVVRPEDAPALQRVIHLGLVALDPEDPNEIIAVVRYAREPGDERAEYAAIVEDRWQGHGVGRGLTAQLIDE